MIHDIYWLKVSVERRNRRDELCNVWWIQLGKDLYFLLNILNLILCALQIYDLNGDSLLGTFVEADLVEERSERPTELYTHPLYTSPNEPFPA